MAEYKIITEKSPQLKRLWEISFEESEEAVRLFFDNMFENAVCFAALESGGIIAALYLLPCEILHGGKSFIGSYLYAAATMPGCRNRGIMRGLIDFASEYSIKRGKDFIALLPSRGSLYEFYRASGFVPCKGTAELDVNLKALSSHKLQKTDFIAQNIAGVDFEKLVSLRERFLSGKTHVAFNRDHLKYAAAYGSFYGAQLFSYQNGYALVYKNSSANDEYDKAVISELVCPEEDFESCLAALALRCGCGQLALRAPFDNVKDKAMLFAVPVLNRRFAMIKPLSVDFPKDAANDIYIGLTLE